MTEQSTEMTVRLVQYTREKSSDRWMFRET